MGISQKALRGKVLNPNPKRIVAASRASAEIRELLDTPNGSRLPDVECLYNILLHDEIDSQVEL